MTFTEAESILKDLRAARRRVNRIRERIAELESDRESISSILGGDGVHGNGINSRVEQLAVRIETEREKHIDALEQYFALEDALADSLDRLTPTEREIITEYYLSGVPMWKIAENVGYERSNVFRHKKKAIYKIAKNL